MTPIDSLVSLTSDLVTRVVAFLNAHLVLAPIALVGASVAVVKYSLILLPDRFPPETHNRIIFGVVAIDAALLIISYFTGVLSLPFGITVPVVDLSGFSLTQPVLALIFGVAGLAGYVVVAERGQKLNLPNGLNLPDRLSKISAPEPRSLLIIGIIVAAGTATTWAFLNQNLFQSLSLISLLYLFDLTRFYPTITVLTIGLAMVLGGSLLFAYSLEK